MENKTEKAKKIFEEMKPKCEIKKLSAGMEMYTATEGNWQYTFFTSHDELKKIEAYNHRELIEVYI